MKKIGYILLILLFNCEQKNLLDLDDNVNLIVVEGWITEGVKIQQIKISRTTAFTSELNEDFIENAQIELFENGSSFQKFYYSGEGYYLSENEFTPVSNKAYQVEILLSNSDTIISTNEILRPILSIQEIGFDFRLLTDPLNPRNELVVYFPVVFASDISMNSEYYWWVVSKNGITFNEPKDIYLLSDTFFNGKSFRNELTEFSYSEGDSIGITIYSISPNAYQYLTQIRNQTVALGTNVSIAPAKIPGNLRYKNNNNTVLGYFGIISSASKGQLITD